MMIKTQDGEKNVASKGLAGAALGLAIPGTVALVNQLAGGAWGLGRAYSGNNGCGCGEVTHDTRVISALESELARVNSERYADMIGINDIIQNFESIMKPIMDDNGLVNAELAKSLTATKFPLLSNILPTSNFRLVDAADGVINIFQSLIRGR